MLGLAGAAAAAAACTAAACILLKLPCEPPLGGSGKLLRTPATPGSAVALEVGSKFAPSDARILIRRAAIAPEKNVIDGLLLSGSMRDPSVARVRVETRRAADVQEGWLRASGRPSRSSSERLLSPDCMGRTVDGLRPSDMPLEKDIAEDWGERLLGAEGRAAAGGFVRLFCTGPDSCLPNRPEA